MPGAQYSLERAFPSSSKPPLPPGRNRLLCSQVLTGIAAEGALMKVQNRLDILKQIYEIHDGYASNVQTACAKGCAACCTCNVAVTTMEGLLVFEYLLAAGGGDRLDQIIGFKPSSRYQPRLTLNQIVALYAEGKQPPEEENDPSAGACPLLEDGICSIYPVRPFGCRAMLSSSDCAVEGEADMPSIILSVNNVMIQYLEAVDRPGWTGNLLDILELLAQDAFRQDYAAEKDPDPSLRLPVNHSFPVLMVPPEHRSAIGPLIQSLNTAVQASANRF